MPGKFIRNPICITVFACCLISTGAYANESLSRKLVDRISRANAELQAMEEAISRESSQYAKKLEAKEQKIKKLREEAAAVQRLTDEKTLGLDKLETRVGEWTTQSHYQKQLLSSYIEGAGLPFTALKHEDGEPLIDAGVLDLAVNHLETALIPGWQEKEIITPAGSVQKIPVLVAGPVELAFDATSGAGGPVITEMATTIPRFVDIFGRSELGELGSLQNSGTGYLSFDPTLGNALELRDGEDDFFGHLRKGGIWVIPIVFFGLLSFVISVLKGSQFVRLPDIDPTLTDRIKEQLSGRPADLSNDNELKQKIERLSTDVGKAQKKLIQIAVSTPVSPQRDDLLVAYLMEHKHTLERFMGVVGTSAAIAPLLGLLGTVSGMISTFKMMTIFGSGDASTVSGGISEALVTTELGLIVAIPSLVVSALLTRKVKSYSHQLENFAMKLSKTEFAG